ncbi:MAG: CRISPR-associated endonuclease Cas2 [Alphaproteobacteria bacterium]|nr:CRISPR-associated endonuclease Cas2 [Alphaproteobacteria bacterium]
MWMMVMFDLPVMTAAERRTATKFRNFLLDQGFEMSQFSVYFRFCGERSNASTYVKAIKKNAPSGGRISILFFTDKQFSDIINIQNRATQPPTENPDQLVLL